MKKTPADEKENSFLLYYCWFCNSYYVQVNNAQCTNSQKDSNNDLFFVLGEGQGADNYFLTEAEMTWTRALNYCRSNHRDLTSIRNEEEHLIVQNLTSGQEVWVGHFKDPWVWSDETASSMRYWPPETEVWSGDGEACGVLLKAESGRWGSGNCSVTYPFLCACIDNGYYLNYLECQIVFMMHFFIYLFVFLSMLGRNVRVIKVKVHLQNSLLDLNEPPARDSLLQQVSTKLCNCLAQSIQ